MKIVGVIDARNDESNSDPNAFVLLAHKPALYHVVERMMEAQLVDEVVLDASGDAGNRPVLELAQELGVCVRRSEEPDILKRLEDVAIVCGAEAVVVTRGRSPLLDPRLIDAAICHFLSTAAEVTSTFPPGDGAREEPSVEVEVISRRGLEKLIAHHRGDWTIDRLARAAHDARGVKLTYLSEPPHESKPELFLSIDNDEQMKILKGLFENLYRAGVPLDKRELAAEVEKAIGSGRRKKGKKK